MRVVHRQPPVRAVTSPVRFECDPASDTGDSAKRGFFGVLAEWARAGKMVAAANDIA
jgi:hypothetical protein